MGADGLGFTLHKSEQDPFYWIGDWPFYVCRRSHGWCLDSYHPDGETWLHKTELDCVVFSTRREAVEAFEAMITTDPIPLDPVLPASALRPAVGGGYEIQVPNSQTDYQIRRSPTGKGWNVIRNGTIEFPEYPSLWWVRCEMAQRHRFHNQDR